MTKKYILLFFVLFSFGLSAQTYNMSNASVNTCTGTFLDSGGTGNYSNSQNFTKTFCPSTPGSIIRFVFTQFNLENNADFLYVYDGNSTTAPLLQTYTGTDLPLTLQPTAANTSGCLTFVFTSDSATNTSGWSANISCVTPCQTIIASLASSTPAAGADGIIKICAGQSITFNGGATFSTSGAGATYTWNFDDGSTAVGQSVIHTFPIAGVYRVNVVVRDPLQCVNSNYINQVVQVADPPSVSIYSDSDEQCINTPLNLQAIVSTQTYDYNCAPPVSGTTYLPDGDGVSYETSVVVDCFDSTTTLTNINQIQSICLNMEHSFIGDLRIEIISPSGQVSELKAYPGGGGTYLGDANDDGSTTPGVGFNYCFAMTGTVILQNGPTTTASDGNATIQAGTYLPSGGFTPLLGSPLNGVWTIRVTDEQAIDNGYIFNWQINFAPSLTPTSLSFTPAITSVTWVADPTITGTSGTTVTVESPTSGAVCYSVLVTNSFGCAATTSKCIDFLDAPAINLTPDDLESCTNVFNLNDEISEILGTLNPSDYDVLFFASEADALAGSPQIPSPTNFIATGTVTTIYVKVEDFTLSCPAYVSFDAVIIDCSPPDPTASVTANTICSGTTGTVTFTGTPNAVVTYTVDSGSNQTITLDAAGQYVLTTPILTVNSTYTLVSVFDGTTTAPLTASATVTVTALPTASISG
uniref:PKD domain-containing protein n=1 Tax=uncultured Flavobacterium sp. TaxID=165435 RepID=UPI0025957AC3